MISFEAEVFTRYQNRLRARAAGLLISLEGRLDRIMQGWLLVAGLACAVRIASSPVRGPLDAATFAPYLLLILAIAAVLNQKGSMTVVLILGLTGWTGIFRLVRAEYLKHRVREYVMAADALGASNTRRIASERSRIDSRRIPLTLPRRSFETS